MTPPYDPDDAVPVSGHVHKGGNGLGGQGSSGCAGGQSSSPGGSGGGGGEYVYEHPFSAGKLMGSLYDGANSMYGPPAYFTPATIQYKPSIYLTAGLHDGKMPEGSVRELHIFLKTFQYKPGWTFRLDPYINWASLDQGTGYVLFTEVDVYDVNPPHSLTPLAGTTQVPGNFGMPVMTWVHQRLAFIEDHERDEWFRVNGVAPYNPHKT